MTGKEWWLLKKTYFISVTFACGQRASQDTIQPPRRCLGIDNKTTGVSSAVESVSNTAVETNGMFTVHRKTLTTILTKYTAADDVICPIVLIFPQPVEG